MNVKDIMTANPECCQPDTSLQKVAEMMMACDCGAIPVVENMETGKPVGVVTDRDIVIRALAQGKNPLDLTARDVMSTDTITIAMDRSVSEAAQTMESNQIRRLIVTDGNGHIIGMLAQADVARKGRDEMTGELVEQISEPVGGTRMGTAH